MTTQRTTAVEQTSVPVEWQAPVSFLVSFYKAQTHEGESRCLHGKLKFSVFNVL